MEFILRSIVASEENIYSQMEKDLLELSLIDIYVLQRLDIIRSPIVRYKLMKDITTQFPFVSIAKFYRILEKFVKLELVILIESEDKQEYILSEKGNSYISQAKNLLDHRGFSIFEHLTTEFPNMFEMMDVNGGNLLVYDYEEIYEPAFYGLLLDMVDILYVLYRESVFDYFHKIHPSIRLTPRQDNVIMTPNDFFDSITVTFHPDIMSDISELTRVLKPKGKLFVTEIESEKSKFFLHNILFDLYAPKHVGKSKKYLDTKQLVESGQFNLMTTYEYQGLRIFKLIKL